MLIRTYEEKSPHLAPTVRAAETAVAAGDVTLGENVSLWYGCVLRGDDGSIEVGDGCNIQDNCVLHDRVRLGKNVTVGHGAIVHGCTVGDSCLIGMGATLLTGSAVGAGSIIGAGALVPEGAKIPPDCVAVGVPAKVVRRLNDKDREMLRSSAAFYIQAAQKELPLAAER